MSATIRTVLLTLSVGFALLGCDRAGDDSKSATAAPANVSGADPFQIVEVENKGDLQAVLATHVAKAKEAGLQPYVEFWADWCPPCKAIEASMKEPAMREAFSGAYLIRLDTDHWGSKLEGSGMDAASIPVFFELDAKGKPTGRKIDGGAWGDNTPENMAPPLNAFFHP
ncbi:MAG: thioredoxin domain-containing protein [Nannocystales bacterium]